MSNAYKFWTRLRSIRSYIARSDGELRFGIRFTELCILLVVAFLFSSVAAFAADNCAKGICVSQAWARATPPGSDTAAIYFSMMNKGSVADEFSGASTPAASQAMLHQTMTKGGMTKMDMVKSVAVPPGATVMFSPAGYHVMLTGLKMPLKEGAPVSITLQIAKAGKIKVPVQVLSATAMGPGDAKASGVPAKPGMPNMHH